MRRLLVLATLVCAACSSGGGKTETQITPTAATPTFSVPAGTKDRPISVSISTTTGQATIHYTTDGSDPTSASSTYAGAIALSTSTTLKAVVTAAGCNPSAVASAVYAFQVAAPGFSPAAGTYATAQDVTVSTTTPGATIHYTTDGSEPTEASPVYGGAIHLAVGGAAATTTVRALGVRTGFTSSAVASAAYTVDAAATPAAEPTFAPTGGTYASAQHVTIASATAGAIIRYTLDGSDPTGASSQYTSPVEIASSGTLKAFAGAPGHTASGVASAAYVIDLPRASTPTFTPPAGTYTSARSVTIASTTAGAVIHCTTDGSAASASSPVCSGAISVPASTTLRAVATAQGYAPSAEATAAYTISGGGGMDWLGFCAALGNKSSALEDACEKSNPALHAIPWASTPFCAEVQAEITAGRVVYDAAAGAACAAAIQGFTCADRDAAGDLNMPTACAAILAGTVANQGSCQLSADCATGYCTTEETQTCPGTCQPYVPLHGDCTHAPCADGLTCDIDYMSETPAPTCLAAAPVEGACPCQDGLWCDLTQGPPGTCKAPKTSGPCQVREECAAGYSCHDQECVALAGADESCATADCATGYTCTAGTCRSWPTAGQACSGYGPCAGGYCDGSACAAYKLLDAACNNAYECATAACRGGHCVASVCP
jgi:hypothetical protein